MNNNPIISIIMSVYNTPKTYLKEAIDSILSQTFTDFEFIIIDDFSTTDIKNIILEYNDHRIVYLENKENKGLAWSLNRGIKISKGRYIARMDADDISLPHRLEKQVKYMENTNTDILSTHVRFMGSLKGETKGSWDFDRIKANLIFENKPIVHPTVMIRKDFLIKNKLAYNEDYKKAQDYELWSRAIKFGRFALLDEPLLLYRIHPNQASTKGSEEQNNYADKVRNNFLESLYPNIKIDILSHKQLSRLDETEDIQGLFNWCNLLISHNRENKIFREDYFEEKLMYRLLIVYLKTLKKSNRKISFLIRFILKEKILRSILKPRFLIKILRQNFIRRMSK